MKILAVEGNTQKLDGGSMFGNAPREMWKRWIQPDELNRIPLACRAMLLQTDDGRNYLFDVGIGAFFEPKFKDRYGVVEDEHVLLKNLHALGIAEEDIHGVILSHLHFDHVGGIVTAYDAGEPRLLFPNATYYTGKEHWERANHPHPRDRVSFIPMINKLLEGSGRLKFIEGESHPDLDFGLSFSYANGHTVGLAISHLQLSDGPMAFVTDLVPGRFWMHIPITMGYDRFPEQSIEEKKVLLENLFKKSGRLFFTHDPEIPCVKVCQDEKGRYYGEVQELSELN